MDELVEDFVLLLRQEHINSSFMPLRKLRLKKAYNRGLMPELKYVTKNVKGVSKALKLESPRYERDL